jgi:hypothetical protein
MINFQPFQVGMCDQHKENSHSIFRNIIYIFIKKLMGRAENLAEHQLQDTLSIAPLSQLSIR